MQRHLILAAGTLALAACSHFDGIVDHHGGHYGDLAKIAKQQDAQHALLLTREGKLVVVNVATSEIIEPGERKRAAKDVLRDHEQHGGGGGGARGGGGGRAGGGRGGGGAGGI